jgi:2,3-bisphosphoglycerate-independent phosphoglycerate mutase
MLEKVILLIFDGLGDRPIDALDGLTPLESANTKNLDKLARESCCAMMYTLGRGLTPGSDVAHLSILGYDLEKFYSGRGPIEAAGIGLKLQPGDVALRGNLGTVEEDLVIKDRRAGRIRDVEPFTKIIDGMEVDGVTFIIKPGTGHRAGVIMRGKDLSSAITDADPHEVGKRVNTVEPADDTPQAKRTADVLNRFLKEAHEVLEKSELNKERVSQDKLKANFLLVRGAGQYHGVPSFKERYGLSACCIAGAGLYKGVGAFLGMDVLKVPGATGLPDTDVEAKFTEALKQLKSHDFAFIHVKAADSLGEDGNAHGKKEFIEKSDKAAAVLQDLPEDTLLIVTADHSTPCELEHHSADPVPIIFHGKGLRVDKVTSFGERACTEGGLGFIHGQDVMPIAMDFLGRSPLLGA